ncbi:MAG: GNAT family N-acetyltransferase [Chitinophagales bacterium]
MSIIYKTGNEIQSDQLLALYNDAGWQAYTSSPETLQKAVSNSLFVLTAWEDEKLVGLLRMIGDGLTIIYIQDILVLKSHQRRGIGKELINRTFEKFRSVRQKVLLTDNTPETLAFYKNTGFKNVNDLELSAFIRIEK